MHLENVGWTVTDYLKGGFVVLACHFKKKAGLGFGTYIFED